MDRIAIIADKEEDIAQLTESLFDPSTKMSWRFNSIEDFMTSNARNKANCLVNFIDEFNREHIPQLADLSKKLIKKPIVFVANELSTEYRIVFGLMHLEYCMVIEKQYEITDLKILLKKLKNGQKTVHLNHCRYPVNTTAKVSIGNKSVPAKALSLSLGGAQLELSTADFHRNNLIRIQFEKHPIIMAKVSWVNEEKSLIGVQFIKN